MLCTNVKQDLVVLKSQHSFLNGITVKLKWKVPGVIHLFG